MKIDITPAVAGSGAFRGACGGCRRTRVSAWEAPPGPGFRAGVAGVLSDGLCTMTDAYTM